MPVKIFVGNLTSDTTGDDIRPLFEQYGNVTECDVLRNFGFVHMEKEDEANVAIEELSGTLVNGQKINVEKSTGTPRGGGGKMMGRGRGAHSMRGFGGPPFRGRIPDPDRDFDPYGFSRLHPYGRDLYPYDYYDYDRFYPLERPLPCGYPPDDRRAMLYERDRLPLPRDYYDRYPPDRYSLPAGRYAAYDRYPPRPVDPYERPPPDYYRDRRSVGDNGMLASRPVPPVPNGLDDRELEPPAPPGESYSSSYSSYYDRFYSKPPTNGAPQMSRLGAPQSGRPPVPSAISRSLAAAAARKDQQAALQTGPILF